VSRRTTERPSRRARRPGSTRTDRQTGALTLDHAPAYAGPTVVVAGQLDSTVGSAAATDLIDDYPHASLAVVDDAGHALPHKQPELLRALLAEWLARVVSAA
jgi:pimeloyl-ACP methyl ester carboxylesterase